MSRQQYAWLLVGLLWVVAFLNYVDRQVIFSLFPLLEKEFHLTGGQLGLLSTVFVWVYGLVGPFTGYLGDRVGRVRMIVASLLIWSLVTWATGHVRSYGELVATRVLMGLSEACYLPAALALIADYHGGKTRSLATGLHQSGLYAGIVVGGVVGGWMGENYGWRSAFIPLGFLGIVYTAIFVWGLRRASNSGKRAAQPNFARSLRELSAAPGFWRLTAVFGAVGLANWLAYTWLPLYLYERFRLSLTSAGFSATFYTQPASFAGILIGGVSADYWGTRYPKGRIWVQAAGLAAAAPFLFLIGAADAQMLLIIALVTFGIGRGIYDSNTMPVLCQVAPAEYRATGYGIFNFFGCVVGGVAAAAAGFLKSVIGLGVAFQVAAVILVGACVALLTVRPNPEVDL